MWPKCAPSSTIVWYKSRKVEGHGKISHKMEYITLKEPNSCSYTSSYSRSYYSKSKVNKNWVFVEYPTGQAPGASQNDLVLLGVLVYKPSGARKDWNPPMCVRLIEVVRSMSNRVPSFPCGEHTQHPNFFPTMHHQHHHHSILHQHHAHLCAEYELSFSPFHLVCAIPISLA